MPDNLNKSYFLAPILLSLLMLNNVQAAGEKTGGTADNTGQFFGAKHTNYPDWFKESFLKFQDDIDEATAAGKRIMLIFYQDGCPYCNALVEKNLAQKDIQEKVKKNFDVIAMNMWGDRELTFVDGKEYIEKDFALALKVQFTPTVLFFDEKGEIVLRLNGYRAPYRFSVDLDYVAQHKEKETNYRDYVKANLKQKPSGKKLHAEDFFQSPPYNLTRTPGSKALAVFFEQKDCPDCDTLHTRVLPDKTLRAVIRNADNVQLDMWSGTEVTTPSGKKTTAREWAKELDIKFAPSIVLFNDKGEEVIRSEAFFKVFHTQGIFQYTISDEYREEPSFQRWLSGYAEHFREQGDSVDIWRYANEKAEARP